VRHLKRPSPEVVLKLMRNVSAKVPGAEAELMKLLAPWLRELIHKHLEPRVRRFEDSEDILQEALMVLVNNFCKRKGIDDPEKFLHCMERVAHNKTISANRRHLDCQKRQDGSEVDFSAEFSEENQPLAPNPEPYQEAEAHETWDRLVENAPEPLKTVLSMKFQGFSNQEIPNQLNVGERGIRKIMEIVRMRLAHEEALNDEEGMCPPSLFLQ